MADWWRSPDVLHCQDGKMFSTFSLWGSLFLMLFMGRTSHPSIDRLHKGRQIKKFYLLSLFHIEAYSDIVELWKWWIMWADIRAHSGFESRLDPADIGKFTLTVCFISIRTKFSFLFFPFHFYLEVITWIHCKKYHVVPSRFNNAASFKWEKEILYWIKRLKVITAKYICWTDAKILLATK